LKKINFHKVDFQGSYNQTCLFQIWQDLEDRKFYEKLLIEMLIHSHIISNQKIIKEFEEATFESTLAQKNGHIKIIINFRFD